MIKTNLANRTNMRMFQKITERNKTILNKPLDSDMIYYSELYEWYTNNAFRSFSLKFVTDQCIYYRTDSKEYKVQTGNYMLACRNSGARAYFNNKTLVKSICIDIYPKTMAETFTVLTSKNGDLDNYLSGYFKYPEFFESISPVQTTAIGSKLQGLLSLIETEGDVPIK